MTDTDDYSYAFVWCVQQLQMQLKMSQEEKNITNLKKTIQSRQKLK